MADSRWKILGDYALEILAIPATSALQERIFNYAGITTEKRKNRTSPQLLNQKLFVDLNKKFFT